MSGSCPNISDVGVPVPIKKEVRQWAKGQFLLKSKTYLKSTFPRWDYVDTSLYSSRTVRTLNNLVPLCSMVAF